MHSYYCRRDSRDGMRNRRTCPNRRDQVYDAAIEIPGKFGLTLHNNFTPSGLKEPAFRGGIIPDRSLNGVPELAYGVSNWFEAGLYLPLFSISRNRGLSLNEAKLHGLFVVPHAADRLFFYGVNLEASMNARYWDQSRFTAEIRPIIGLHLRPVDIIFNPIVDTAYTRLKNLTFAPAVRVAYNVSDKWTVAVEEYASLGRISNFHFGGSQSHQLYAVIDHSTKFFNVEAGLGFGLTPASDSMTIKLMLTRELN